MLTLKPHQVAGAEFMFDNAHGCLNASQPGTGKTAMAITAMCMLRPKRVLIVCPGSIMYNWEAEIGMWATHPYTVHVLDGTKAKRLKILAAAGSDADVMVVNYEMLNNIGVELIKWAPNLIVADECFPAGTLVKTLSGYENIELLKEGDIVCNAIGHGTVLSTSSRVVDSLIKINTDRGSFLCTSDHPVFTNCGWIKAYELNQSHYIKTHEQTMSIMWSEFSSASTEKILREVLLSEMEDVATRGKDENIQQSSKREDKFFSPKSQTASAETICKNSHAALSPDDCKQSHETGRNKRESKRHSQKNQAQACDTWREWYGSNKGRSSIVQKAKRVCLELCCFIKKLWKRLSEPLQNRHRLSKDKVSHRGGWDLPQSTESPTARSQERSEAQGVRVDSIESVERESLERYGYSGERVKVYNLHVSGHPSYIVTKNDCVVHNCHKIKSFKAISTKALKAIADRAKTPYRWIMSGTPTPNNPLDIWSQYDFIRPGYLGPNFYAFRATYANVYTGAGFPMIKGFKNQEQLKKLVGKYMYRVTKDECLDLPPVTYQTIKVEFSDKSKKIYRSMAEHMVAEIGNQTVNANIILVKMLRLQEMTSGFTKDSIGNVIEIGKEKLNALLDLLESLGKEKVIIWCRFNHEIEMVKAAIKKEYPDRKIHLLAGSVSNEDRQSVYEEFQRGSHTDDVILANVQVGGVGINLTASAYAIYFSRTFSFGDADQSESRVNRLGQTRNVTYYDLVVGNSIDEYILKTIQNKSKMSDHLTGDDVKKIALGII